MREEAELVGLAAEDFDFVRDVLEFLVELLGFGNVGSSSARTSSLGSLASAAASNSASSGPWASSDCPDCGRDRPCTRRAAAACGRWPCGTSTWIIRIGLNENSRFQIVRRRSTVCERSKTVDEMVASFGSYFKSLIAIGNSTSGRGPLNSSSACGAGEMVVTTPGANCRAGR